MTGRSSGPRRSYGGRTAEERRAERRQRLLAAGLELFGTKGYAATSIEKLCSAAGVSTRNFYEEFTGREALLIALHEQLNEQSSAAAVAALSAVPGLSLREQVERGVRAYLEVSAGDPRWARINYVEVIGVSPELERHRLEWRSRWVSTLVAVADEAAARGEATPRDYTLTAVAVIGAVNNLVHYWSVQGGAIPLDSITDEFVRLVTAVLTAP